MCISGGLSVSRDMGVSGAVCEWGVHVLESEWCVCGRCVLTYLSLTPANHGAPLPILLCTLGEPGRG